MILGRMHALSKIFHLDEVHRPVWSIENTDVLGIRGRVAPWIREEYDNLMISLCHFDITPETYGLIHNDFHQGNLIIKEGTITTIDFDECSYNWFAQDIAVAFYHAYWQNKTYNVNVDRFTKTFYSCFFAGYQAEKMIQPEMIKQIPIFLKLREIFLYQLFIQKWDLNQLEEWQRFTLDD